MNNKETYLYWLQANTQKNYLSERKNLEEYKFIASAEDDEEDGGIVDTIQNYADVVSAGASFVPVVGQGVGAVMDLASGAVDVAQGQYGDAAMRGGMAAASAIPFAGGAAKLGKAAKGLSTAAKATDAAATAAKTTSNAVDAAKAGTQGAQAVSAATKSKAEIQKTVRANIAQSRNARTASNFDANPLTPATTNAVDAAKTGTQGAQAVASGARSKAEIQKSVRDNIQRSRDARMASGYREGNMQLPPKYPQTKIARPQKTAIQKAIQRVRVTDKMAKTGRLGKLGKYGRLALLGYGASKLLGSDDDGSGRIRIREPEYLGAVGAETRSNLVGQSTQPTMSQRRREPIDPAFGYYGAQQMFRPIGYGLAENNLNSMVNKHVNKFLKSRKGAKLKSEVNSIVKKVD